MGRPDQVPPGTLPQVAFSGRSNVGKSSLINRLLGRTRTPVARVSATPGKTQEINFYDVRAESSAETPLEFGLVDLPGYGYARVPHAVRERWRPLIEHYLSRTDALRGVVQLIDARHGPSKEDRQMFEYLERLQVPTLFVLTKSDKIKREELAERTARTLEEVGGEPEQLIAFSTVTGLGRDELLMSMESLLIEGE